MYGLVYPYYLGIAVYQQTICNATQIVSHTLQLLSLIAHSVLMLMKIQANEHSL